LRELELDLEVAEILPDRQTLAAFFSLTFVVTPQLNVGLNTAVLSPSAAQAISLANVANFHF